MINLEFLGYHGYSISSDGEVINIKSGKVLKPFINDNGYCIVTLRNRISGNRDRVRVHRLLALAFIPKIEGKPHVNHKDGDKTNNCTSNLEWVNRSENILHAHENGLFVNRPRSIPDEVVHEMCKLYEQGWTPSDVANHFGVDNVIAHNIARGKTYTYISKNYDIANAKKKETLSDIAVVDICTRIAEGRPLKEIASSYGVSASLISSIKCRRNHVQISKDYDW